MGKPSGFIDWQRVLPRKRVIAERLADWKEVYLPIAEAAQSREQAGRCMECGVPFCQQGCPLGNPIPDFNDLVFKDRWREAHRKLASTNNFPEFTGRLCPAPCEAACVLSIDPTEARRLRPTGEAGGVPTSAAERTAGGVPTSAAERTPGGAPTSAAERTPGGAPTSAAERTPGGVPTSAAERTPGGVPTSAAERTPGGVPTSAAERTPGGAPTSAVERTPGGGSPVTIEEIEKEIVEHAFAHGWIAPEPPRARSGKRVAVVGSGPAGLAAAAQLNRAGHAVIVYEQAARPGGLLRYGIPDFKMEKWVIDRRLALLEAEGIDVRCGVTIGESPTWDRLRAEHDALVIAIGARRGRDLDVPGRELDGVVMAMDYLCEQNEVVAGDRDRATHDARGQRVIVLGGGDTGSDCLGTALRQRAAHVAQIELLPAPPEARDRSNPWPEWPMIFRTSSSQEEGGDRGFALRTTRLDGSEGRLIALRAEKIATGEEVVIPVDKLVLALGFTGPDATPVRDQLGVALDARGNVATDAGFATNVPGVYACGDAKRGASLIVWAIAEGRETARHVDAYLRGAPSWLPARGQDLPFGGR